MTKRKTHRWTLAATGGKTAKPDCFFLDNIISPSFFLVSDRRGKLESFPISSVAATASTCAASGVSWPCGSNLQIGLYDIDRKIQPSPPGSHSLTLAFTPGADLQHDGVAFLIALSRFPFDRIIYDHHRRWQRGVSLVMDELLRPPGRYRTTEYRVC